MVKIESLKDYLNILDEEELESLSTKIYMIIDLICKDYPKHKEWFFTKQLPETINTNKRNILFVKNDKNEIISMACLKKYETEQKICTLYVSDSCRGLGIGSAIIEESMKWLETTKPFITIADYKLEMFRPIIEKYNWKLTEIVSGFYNNKSQELCFNGILINNKTIKTQLYKKLVYAINCRIKDYK